MSGSAQQVARAAALAPGNARYQLREAELRAAAGEDPQHALERAAKANPYDAEAWSRAGLAAEMDGKYSLAERCLSESARLSSLYEPRWTLANFYFRRGRMEEFWKWTRSGLEWAYGDRTPLFRLAWEAGVDGDEILNRAMGNDAKVLNAYLHFLLATGRLEAAEGCAARLEGVADSSSRGALLAYAGRMIGARRPEQALAAWNALCARKLLPYEVLDAAAGRVLTNGDFAHVPLDTGFDWRMIRAAGVSMVPARNSGLMQVSFSGKQPESCELLWQFVPVRRGRDYCLRFEYQTEGVGRETGLAWRVSDAVTGAELAVQSPLLAGELWRSGSVRFTAPAAAGCIRLTLAYGRMPGTTRIEGTLRLRGVLLEEER